MTISFDLGRLTSDLTGSKSLPLLPGGAGPVCDSFPKSQSFFGMVWAGILPALIWFGIAVLVGLLLFLLWKLFNRGTTSISRKDEPQVTTEFLDSIPDWFKELKDNNSGGSLTGRNLDVELRETILIGLGPVGRSVISRIVANLNSRFGDDWRSKIHVIQVDADLRKKPEARDWQIPTGLKEHEWVLLQPELQEIEARIQKKPQDWRHLQWYEKTAPVYGRSQSRVALFFDLRDGPSSHFWQAVETAYNNLDKPVIRVIGSTFDSVSSGILVDVAFLVKQGITRRNADAELWLLGPAQAEWVEHPASIRISRSEQTIRTLATLRELERFQRNSRVAFEYVPPASNYSQLNQVYDYGVIPTVFLFDPLTRNLTHAETMREMSNALTSLLYEKTANALSVHLSHNRQRAAGKSVVCGVGHFELRLSSGMQEEAVTWRMVKDILFESAMGLFPLEQLQKNGEYQELQGFVPSPSLDVLKEQDAIKRWIIYSVKTGDRRKFYNNIVARLGQILNGEPASTVLAVQGRRMALDKAERWLKLLNNTVKMYPEIQVLSKINKLQGQLSIIRNWLGDEVFSLARSRWHVARENLRNMYAGAESDIPADLEWTAYRENILLTEAQKSKHIDQSPLLKFALRFGWHVSFNDDEEDWKIDLVVPPATFTWQAGSRPEYYSVSLSASGFLDSLYRIALPFAQTGMGRSAVERANNVDVSHWAERVDPLLRYDDLEASRLIGSIDHLRILGASESLAPKETQELAGKLNSVLKTSLQVCDTQDRSVVHLLHVVDWIPFEATYLYDDDQWMVNVVPPSSYVWPLEQWASGIERDSSNRLSVAFLSRYNEYEKFITSFGIGLIYGLFTCDGDGSWNVPSVGDTWKRVEPEQNPHMASSLLGAFFAEQGFERHMDGYIFAWNELIDQQRKAVADSAYEFFRDFEQTKLKVYFRNEVDDAGLERDLGIFLTYLVEVEKQTLRAR